ncbi:hypothetical protein AVEN_248678-1 [Araneus ventricosus]|uniref:Uncharacterized protein n=1 Tax=Araneus ventricosus TaxID=182803 RepID=A0A4Y2C1U7_ARAVE|nr:hypothetical protein AVEN_248678-1 [Araneus ventricosus]
MGGDNPEGGDESGAYFEKPSISINISSLYLLSDKNSPLAPVLMEEDAASSSRCPGQPNRSGSSPKHGMRLARRREIMLKELNG